MSPNSLESLYFQSCEDEVGLRLDKWLSGQIPDMSRSRIKELILGGHLKRNGEVLRIPRTGIGLNEEYSLCVPPLLESKPAPEAIPLEIVYEDSHLLVIDKPAGLVVHPAPGARTGTLVNALLHHCGDSLSGIGGVRRPGIVHRLDKDSSGLMLAAKSQEVHVALSQMFAKQAVEKAYLALSIGAPVPGKGSVEAMIGRDRGDYRKMSAGMESGKKSLTLYKTLRCYGRDQKTGRALASLLECRPRTGRTHQIRVHMSYVGTPLIGDSLYGGRRGLRLGSGTPESEACADIVRHFPRQALHSRYLSFLHPKSGQKLHFEVPPPQDFANLAKALAGLDI